MKQATPTTKKELRKNRKDVKSDNPKNFKPNINSR